MNWEEEATAALVKRNYELIRFYYEGGLVYVHNRDTGCVYPIFQSSVVEWMEEDKK